jgi:hypothetical protein
MGTPSPHPNVTPFSIPPQTPRTDATSKFSGTPQKHKSPNSLLKDVTMDMANLNTSMDSPPKEALNTTINPQSKKRHN